MQRQHQQDMPVRAPDMSVVELQKLQETVPSGQIYVWHDSHKSQSHTTITVKGYCFGDGSRGGVTQNQQWNSWYYPCSVQRQDIPHSAPSNQQPAASTPAEQSDAPANQSVSTTPTVTTPSHSPLNEPRVKLTKLSLKKFNGEPTSWALFWDAFESSVPELSDIDQFNYLHPCWRFGCRFHCWYVIELSELC